MPRMELDRRLNELRAAVLDMGDGVEAAIGRAVYALARQDRDLASAVIAGDDAIDRRCAAIEETGARLIALQQPALGDHAEGIARLALRLPHPPDGADMLALNGLAALARVQLQGALDAYRALDAARARSVWSGDTAVDSLHGRLVQSLLSAMVRDQDALTTDTYLLWVSHNLERIGDRAGNICERVVFIATGERGIKAAS